MQKNRLGTTVSTKQMEIQSDFLRSRYWSKHAEIWFQHYSVNIPGLENRIEFLFAKIYFFHFFFFNFSLFIVYKGMEKTLRIISIMKNAAFTTP